MYTALIFGLWTAYVAGPYGLVQQLVPAVGLAVNELVRAIIFVGPVFALGFASPDLKLRENVGRGIAWGLLAGIGLLALNAAVAAVASGELHANGVPIKAYFTSLSVAVLIEEIAFRGFLLQKLIAVTGFWRANAISAGLFAAIHVPGWLLVDGASLLDKLGPLASIFGLGLIAGFLLRRTGSLWSCFFLHSANNLAAILFSNATRA